MNKTRTATLALMLMASFATADEVPMSPLSPSIIHLLLWLQRQYQYSYFGSLHMAFYMLLIVVISIAVASMSYKLIERPSINLGYKLRRSC